MTADYISRLGFRWLTSIIITWAFLAALMTAIAQQRVSTSLDARPDKPAYSSALGKVNDLAAARQEMTAKQATSAKQMDQIQEQQKKLDDTLAALSRAWDDIDLDSISTQAKKAGCEIAVPTAGDPHLAAWQSLVGCLRAGSLPSQLAGQLKAAVGGPEDYAKLYANWEDATREKARLLDQQQRLDGEIAADKKQIEDGDSLSSAFSDLVVLRSPWLGFGFLINVPPPMLQILIAFISGAFGALLITLVLVVYPKSELAGAAGQEYGSRLLLGGLISVGVFVILSGGSAVLGSSVAFSQSQANFMTFSAVGVLAGMFSDRVAAWLSERANAFFSGNKPAGAANDPGAEAKVAAAAKVAAE